MMATKKEELAPSTTSGKPSGGTQYSKGWQKNKQASADSEFERIKARIEREKLKGKETKSKAKKFQASGLKYTPPVSDNEFYSHLNPKRKGELSRSSALDKAAQSYAAYERSRPPEVKTRNRQLKDLATKHAFQDQVRDSRNRGKQTLLDLFGPEEPPKRSSILDPSSTVERVAQEDQRATQREGQKLRSQFEESRLRGRSDISKLLSTIPKEGILTTPTPDSDVPAWPTDEKVTPSSGALSEGEAPWYMRDFKTTGNVITDSTLRERMARADRLTYTGLVEKDDKRYPGVPEGAKIPAGLTPTYFKNELSSGKKPETIFRDFIATEVGELPHHVYSKKDLGIETVGKKVGNFIDKNITGPFAEDFVPQASTLFDETVGDAYRYLTSTGEEYEAENERRLTDPTTPLNRMLNDELNDLARDGYYRQEDGTFVDEKGNTFKNIDEAIKKRDSAGPGWAEPQTPMEQTAQDAGATTPEEAKAAEQATESSVAAPPSAQDAADAKEAADSNKPSPNKAQVNGGPPASGTDTKDAVTVVKEKGGDEEQQKKAAIVDSQVPKSMLTDPMWKQLNSMPPATEAEVGFFESPAFQTSMLTFGLAMLTGRDPQDALRIAGNAYYQSHYKTTAEYKELRRANVPDSVIHQAIVTNDWKDVKEWRKEGLEALEKQAERNNPYRELNKSQREALTDYRGLYGKLRVEMQPYIAGVAEAESYLQRLAAGEKFTAMDEIRLMNALQAVVDPKATVKEADVALMKLGVSFSQSVRDRLRQAGDFTTQAGREAAFKALGPEIVKELVGVMYTKSAVQLKAAQQSLLHYTQGADAMNIPREQQSWLFSDFGGMRFKDDIIADKFFVKK